MEKLWTKRKDLIRSKTDNSDYYHEKYIKIKFESNNDFKGSARTSQHHNSC